MHAEKSHDKKALTLVDILIKRVVTLARDLLNNIP